MAEDEQMKAHETHMQTLERLMEMQTSRIDATVLQYEEDRKVGPLCRSTVRTQMTPLPPRALPVLSLAHKGLNGLQLYCYAALLDI